MATCKFKKHLASFTDFSKVTSWPTVFALTFFGSNWFGGSAYEKTIREKQPTVFDINVNI